MIAQYRRENFGLDFSHIQASAHLDQLDRPTIGKLQRALNIICYPAGPIDGLLGTRTRSTWDGFKHDHNIGGPNAIGVKSIQALEGHLQALQLNHDFSTRERTETAIINECRAQGLGLNTQVAYVLATAQHETNNTMLPVVEAYYLQDQKKWTPERVEQWRRANFSYYPYHGRGYVQLTWLRNYEFYGQLLGLDLVHNPNLVLDPDVSCFILVHGFKTGAFTGRALEQYVNLRHADYRGARRCINGTDRAAHIAGLAEEWARRLEG